MTENRTDQSNNQRADGDQKKGFAGMSQNQDAPSGGAKPVNGEREAGNSNRGGQQGSESRDNQGSQGGAK